MRQEHAVEDEIKESQDEEHFVISFRAGDTEQDQEEDDEISDDSDHHVANFLPLGEEAHGIGKIQSVIKATRDKRKQNFFFTKFDSYISGCLPTSKICEGGKRLVDRWEVDLKSHLLAAPTPMKAPTPYTESFELANYE